MFAKRCIKKPQRGKGTSLSEGAEQTLQQSTKESSSTDDGDESRGNAATRRDSESGGEGQKKSEEDSTTPLKTLSRRTKVPIAGKHYLTANFNNDNRATAVFDVDPDKAHDHRAILERNEEISRKIEKGELESGIYRGQGAHRVYVHRSEGALSNAKSTGLYGPVRGTNNVRMTMYVDYNPEICKDYKETGYCGFGNTCKFLHDRHDYKGGWQIEREWQEQQQKKQAKLAKLAARRVGCSSSGDEGRNSSDDTSSCDSDEVSSDDEEQLPFACLKCKQKWREEMNPVVTRCGHYFCEKCAFSHYSKSIKCYACGNETQGIFNAAHKLIEKVKQKEAESGTKNKESDVLTTGGSTRKRCREEGSLSSNKNSSSSDSSDGEALNSKDEFDSVAKYTGRSNREKSCHEGSAATNNDSTSTQTRTHRLTQDKDTTNSHTHKQTHTNAGRSKDDHEKSDAERETSEEEND